MHLEIHRARQRSGASVEQLAAYADVPVADLKEWERRGETPRKHAGRVKWAIWAADRDAALAKSGLPDCEWMSALDAAAEPPDPEELASHMDACPTCRDRSQFIAEHVRPMPPMGSGPIFYAMALLGRLSPWQQSAAGGAMLLLAMGGIGVAYFLFLAAVNLDPSYLLGASGLFAVLVTSGAVGGVVHYNTRALRATGTLGHYTSSVLTVCAYLGAVLGLAAMTGMVVGWETVGPDMEEMITTPVGWIIMGFCGVFFGLVFGRAMRE